MFASHELSSYCRQLAMLEVKLAELEAQEKELCANEGDIAVNALNIAIQKKKEEKRHVRYEYQEQLKELAMATQRYISYEAQDPMPCFMELQKRYYHFIDWLCKHEVVDRDGKQKTGWAQFQHDNPHFNIWNYDN